MSGARQQLRPVAAAVFIFAALPTYADERARFLFELDGIPVGTVELALSGQEYRYTSTHLFARSADRGRTRVRSASFQLVDGARDEVTGEPFESLWLWRRPPQGCQRVRSELEGRTAVTCVQSVQGESVLGTLGDESFRAEYDGERLRTLALGRAKFSRIDGAGAPPPPPKLFEEGWPIDGARGTLHVEGFAPDATAASRDALRAWKSASSARALAREVRRRFEDDPSATCVDQVRAFAEASATKALGDVVVLHGLVAERGADRAFPHVWVRIRTRDGWVDLDPTLGGEVSAETHVALVAVPASDRSGHAGRVWLSFTASRARVARLPVSRAGSAREPSPSEVIRAGDR